MALESRRAALPARSRRRPVVRAAGREAGGRGWAASSAAATRAGPGRARGAGRGWPAAAGGSVPAAAADRDGRATRRPLQTAHGRQRRIAQHTLIL